VSGLKALTYFQIGTIIAMVTGLVAINIEDPPRNNRRDR
jgi:aerobic C4-dicarboxylate transport protein